MSRIFFVDKEWMRVCHWKGSLIEGQGRPLETIHPLAISLCPYTNSLIMNASETRGSKIQERSRGFFKQTSKELERCRLWMKTFYVDSRLDWNKIAWKQLKKKKDSFFQSILLKNVCFLSKKTSSYLIIFFFCFSHILILQL